MIRIIRFSKLIRGHDWSIKKILDDCIGQLKVAFSDKSNFKVEHSLVRWQGYRVRIIFTENFERENIPASEENRFSEFTELLLLKGFGKVREDSFDETQILEQGFSQEETRTIHESKPLAEWAEKDFNAFIKNLKKL